MLSYIEISIYIMFILTEQSFEVNIFRPFNKFKVFNIIYAYKL